MHHSMQADLVLFLIEMVSASKRNIFDRMFIHSIPSRTALGFSSWCPQSAVVLLEPFHEPYSQGGEE